MFLTPEVRYAPFCPRSPSNASLQGAQRIALPWPRHPPCRPPPACPARPVSNSVSLRHAYADPQPRLQGTRPQRRPPTRLGSYNSPPANQTYHALGRGIVPVDGPEFFCSTSRPLTPRRFPLFTHLFLPAHAVKRQHVIPFPLSWPLPPYQPPPRHTPSGPLLRLPTLLPLLLFRPQRRQSRMAFPNLLLRPLSLAQVTYFKSPFSFLVF